MLKTFNCGIGAVLIVDVHSVNDVLQEINEYSDTATAIGQVLQCISGMCLAPDKIFAFKIYMCKI